MRRSLDWCLLFCLLAIPFPVSAGEVLAICGGPALRKWDDLRAQEERCVLPPLAFVRAALFNQSQGVKNGDAVTLLVYRDGLVRRSAEDREPWTARAQDLVERAEAKLIWVTSSSQVLSYLKLRGPFRQIDFYGYATPQALLLDYECRISRGSSSWLAAGSFAGSIAGSLVPNGSVKFYPAYTGWKVDFSSLASKFKQRLGQGASITVPLLPMEYSVDPDDSVPIRLAPGSRWLK